MVKDLTFEIIQTCPNNCKFCSSCASMDKKEIIDFETFKKVINHFMKLGGIQELSISGGEPFLHPDIFNIIMYAKSFNIRVVLYTSGIKENVPMSQEELNVLKNKIHDKYASYKGLSSEEIEKYTEREMNVYIHYNKMKFEAISNIEMQYLKHIGLDKIVFDFQGSERETYDYLMGSDHFTLVESSMIRAVKAGIETDVHFVPMKYNYKELPDIIEILNIAGINNLSILNFVPQGRGKEHQEELMLSTEEINEFKEIYESEKDIFKGNIRLSVPLEEDSLHKCTAGFDKLVIKYDGTVLPCAAFKEFDKEVLQANGFNVLSIYEDLNKIRVINGTRQQPLCKKLYNFDSIEKDI